MRPRLGIKSAHKTPQFYASTKALRRSSGFSPPLSYGCPYLIKMWGIISLNFDNVLKQALKNLFNLVGISVTI